MATDLVFPSPVAEAKVEEALRRSLRPGMHVERIKKTWLVKREEDGARVKLRAGSHRIMVTTDVPFWWGVNTHLQANPIAWDVVAALARAFPKAEVRGSKDAVERAAAAREDS